MSPEQVVRFSATASVTLDATGGGQCSIGPGGTDWVVRTTTVSVAPLPPATAVVRQPQVNTYVGAVSPATLVDGSYSGAGDTSDTKVLLQPGEQLYAVWTGGDAGARATLRATGSSYPAGTGVENL